MAGGVGVPPGLHQGGFGDVGHTRDSFSRMSAGMERLPQIEESVENDQVNIKRYVKDFTSVCRDMFKATGAMFEQEHLCFISMIMASRSGGPNGGGYHKTVMENKVIQYLRAVNKDKSLFRQWRQKFTTALRQVGGAHEEIVHRLVKEIDLGREMEKVVTGLKGEYGDEFDKVSGDVWNILIDKAEMEAYGKIKMVPKGQGVVAYGVLCRWFTDVSGLGLAEQARMLMHPAPPKRKEELAEHVKA